MHIRVPENVRGWVLIILSLGALVALGYGNFGPRPHVGALIPFELLGKLGIGKHWLSELKTHSDKVAHVIAGAYLSALVFAFTRAQKPDSKTRYLAQITLLALTLFVAAEVLQYLSRSHGWCLYSGHSDRVAKMCGTLYFSFADIGASFIGHLAMLCIFFWPISRNTSP